MRDVRWFTSRDEFILYGATGVISNSYRERTVIRTQRGDPVSTNRLPDGSYGLPTNYEAFFAVTSPIGAEAEWIDSIGSYRRVVAKSAGDRGTYNHGCTGLIPQIPSAIINRALNQALLKIKSNDLNLLVAFGEIRDSAKTIMSLLSDVLKIADGVKRITNPKHLAEEWLRYQYGLKPLMSDIYSAVQIIDNGLGSPQATVVVQVKDDSFGLPSTAGNQALEYSGDVSRGCKVSYTFGIANPEAFKSYQLGLTDPLGLVWELTTMSFVVDWFLHVGDYLSGLIGPIGTAYTSGYRTDFLDNDFQLSERLHPAPGAARSISKYGWAKTRITTESMKRWVLTSYTGPKPYLDFGLSGEQLVNLTALLAARRP